MKNETIERINRVCAELTTLWEDETIRNNYDLLCVDNVISLLYNIAEKNRLLNIEEERNTCITSEEQSYD